MDCPVDFIKIDENKARLTAFFVLVLTIVYLCTSFWLIMAFLLVDFTLRTFNLGRYSLLGFFKRCRYQTIKDQNLNLSTVRQNVLPPVWVWFLPLPY